jgi:hypothetical protein
MPGNWHFVIGSIATNAFLGLPATTVAFSGSLTNTGTVDDAGALPAAGGLSSAGLIDIESGATLALLAGGTGSGNNAFVSASGLLQVGSAGASATLATRSPASHLATRSIWRGLSPTATPMPAAS